MNSNFKILNNTYKTINYFNKLLINYPKKEIVLRNNIEKNNYELIECIFAYNINKFSLVDFEINVFENVITILMIDIDFVIIY